MSSTHLCAAFGAVLLIGATPAAAQLLEVGDDGVVITRTGPVITTQAGATPLVPSTRVAAQALATVTARPAIGGARMVPIGALDTVFQAAARQSGVDVRLLHAVAWQESRFRHASVSPKGALGIMQLMPDTARELGVDPHDLFGNLAGGARLLARLLRQYRGDLDLTLAAYNAGPDAVRRWGGVPPYAETRNYVRSIRSSLPL